MRKSLSPFFCDTVGRLLARVGKSLQVAMFILCQTVRLLDSMCSMCAWLCGCAASGKAPPQATPRRFGDELPGCFMIFMCQALASFKRGVTIRVTTSDHKFRGLLGPANVFMQSVCMPEGCSYSKLYLPSYFEIILQSD